MGINVSGQIPGTTVERGYALPSFGGNYSQDNADSKWVSNQTSIIANNGGNIKVNETLTNIGAIVGSLSEDNKLSIDTKKLVTEDLKDYNKGENYGIDVSGIGKDTWVPQTGVQYGSHDKEQNTNVTFANTEITENGVKLDLEKLGINTDITKAQVVTKDEVVEQIDTVLHTDLINTTTRNQVMVDILQTGALIPEIAQGIKEGLNKPGETVLGQISNNMAERSDDIKAFVEGRDKKLDKELDKHRNEKGELIYDADVKKLIAETAQETLDEFGKGKYLIVFLEGDKDGPSMSINDEDGKMYINTNGAGFGNAEEIRKNAQHEGGHGTYKDEDTDKRATERLGNKDKELTPANTIIDPSMKAELQAGLDAYNKDREDGKLRDKEYQLLAKMSSDEILKNAKEYIKISKEQGLVYAPLALEHFLSGEGTPFKINKDWFRGFGVVLDAEQTNIDRFFNVGNGTSEGEPGKQTTKGTPLNALIEINKKYGGMEKMKVGDTVTFKDYWVAAVNFADQKNSAEKVDAFFTLGQTAIKTSATVTVKKKNENDYEITLTNVTYTLNDYYDWHGNDSDRKDVKLPEKFLENQSDGRIKGVSINFQDEAMLKLEREKGAKPFAYDLTYSGADKFKTIDLKSIANTYVRKGNEWKPIKTKNFIFF